MKVGILGIFQNYQGRESDAEMMRDEMRVAELAEPLGFDSSGRPSTTSPTTRRARTTSSSCRGSPGARRSCWLGTGAVIVPWNDPLRVAEKIAVLDHLSGGRAVLGLGRGLSRLEYDHFQIDMNEARDRFDEGSRMIIDALEKGEIEGAGPYYPQVRTPIRPRPLARLPRPLLLRRPLARVGRAGGAARRHADDVHADAVGDVRDRPARGRTARPSASTRAATRRRRSPAT